VPKFFVELVLGFSVGELSASFSTSVLIVLVTFVRGGGVCALLFFAPATGLVAGLFAVLGALLVAFLDTHLAELLLAGAPGRDGRVDKIVVLAQIDGVDGAQDPALVDAGHEDLEVFRAEEDGKLGAESGAGLLVVLPELVGVGAGGRVFLRR